MSIILDWVNRYTELGLGVIPTRPGSKKPAVNWLKFQEQKASPEQLQSWFETAEYGLAVVCGRVSGGLVVLDFDQEAELSYQTMLAQLPQLGPTLPVVKTGQGLHLYVRFPFEVRNVVLAQTPAGGVLIETRGEGGYVVAPPTLHPTGVPYAWQKPLEHIPLLSAREGYKLLGVCAQLHGCRQPQPKVVKQPLPTTISPEEKLSKYAQGALRLAGEELAQLRPGGRNRALNRTAFRLGRFVGAGLLGEAEVEPVLRQACVQNGLISEDGESAFERTLKSGLSAGVKLAWLIPELEQKLG